MPEPRPELIVVSGHQVGQRAVVMNDVAFVGRSSHCDMQIHEPFISRRHVKFQLAPGGWIIEQSIRISDYLIVRLLQFFSEHFCEFIRRKRNFTPSPYEISSRNTQASN